MTVRIRDVLGVLLQRQAPAQSRTAQLQPVENRVVVSFNVKLLHITPVSTPVALPPTSDAICSFDSPGEVGKSCPSTD
jgi:hypothetical protein